MDLLRSAAWTVLVAVELDGGVRPKGKGMVMNCGAPERPLVPSPPMLKITPPFGSPGEGVA